MGARRAGAGSAAPAGRSRGGEEGLALGRRDGGDRGHIRCGGPAGRIPPCRRRGVSPVIRVHGLAKRFGDTRVLSGIDFELADGFLLVTGPNGSGKTTLLRILARLAAPSAGVVELPSRETIGYLGHSPNVYRELTPLENLTLFARLYRVERERVGMLL